MFARGRVRRLPCLLAGVGVAAACGVGPAAVAGPVTVSGSAVQLLAATDALIMTGTDMHTVYPAWVHMAIDHYIAPTLGGSHQPFPLETPEEFWPFGGIRDESIDDSIAEGLTRLNIAIAAVEAQHIQSGDPSAPIVVFGFSQSADIVTEKKRELKEAAAQGQSPPPLSFVVIGNPSRPNGGINERFAGLSLPGLTFTGATPTDTTFTTVDIARQYDPAADFPLYPPNPFALANAVMGLLYNHNYEVVTLDPTDPLYNPGTVVQQFGDTTYYFIPSEHLPLLQPLYDLGVPPVILDAIDPVLRCLVELGYDRSIPFGQPTRARLLPELGRAKPAPSVRTAATKVAVRPASPTAAARVTKRTSPGEQRGDARAGHGSVSPAAGLLPRRAEPGTRPGRLR